MNADLAKLREMLGHDLAMEDVIEAAQVAGRVERRTSTPAAVSGFMAGLIQFRCEDGPDTLFTVDAIRRGLVTVRALRRERERRRRR